MIVRDAEQTLERACASVRPHVDELVIVDTGSTDRTVEIAAGYADTLVGFQWCDDFAAARQHAFDHCTGDWVMHLDADDELHGGEQLRAGLATVPDEVGALHWRYVTGRDGRGVPTTEFWRERCTRRGWYRWAGAVHEVLLPTREASAAREESIWVEHHGHGDGTASLARNVRILEAAIGDNPAPDPRLLFYCGRDLLGLGELERALLYLSRYLLVATWTDERYIAQLLVGYIHRTRGDYSRAIDADLAALKVTPLWPDAYFSLAEDCYHLEQWERVLHWSRIGQSLPAPDSPLFTHPAAYEYGWMIYYAAALSSLGRIEEAATITARALLHAPDDPMHRHNAEVLSGELARLAGAEG
ncbi:MAG TPA: glycosyltransferase [Ktedonobacterales bacterium]|nr:glycosyltransferase [Ktedonobacterales bacterium]